MKILAHRGYWKKPEEKNTINAFARAFACGFGIETDIRDYQGELVISHDVPRGDEVSFKEFLNLAQPFIENNYFNLAINVKADGLAKIIKAEIGGFQSQGLFFFDMSAPDMRVYLRESLQVYSRVSEHEVTPIWLNESAGVWLDSFDSDWFDVHIVEDFIRKNKKVCVVSPELHGRPHLSLWERLLPLENCHIELCTDFPEEAQKFFS